MPQGGEINLKEVKATYSVQDIIFVDSREIDMANEYRVTFEVCEGIGWTTLGVVIANFSWIWCMVTVIFLGFGFFNFLRYIGKYKKMKVNK